MNDKAKRIWITWERHTRSRSLSKELGADLIEIVVKGNRVKRYFVSVFKTLSALKKFSGETVFFQNPSMVLAFLMVFVRLISNKKFVMDCHNAGVFPLEGRVVLLNKVALFLIKNVDFVILTNGGLSDYLEQRGAKTVVLPDPLPMTFYNSEVAVKKPILNVVFICTWAKDEPFLEVIDAVSKLESPVNFYVTGKVPERFSAVFEQKNIILTGFLPDKDYLKLILESDLVIDLTTREDCLVCGAYEAMAAGAPCIVSDSKVSRQIFKKGFVYSHNDTQSILNSLEFALKNLEHLQDEMRNYRTEYQNLIRREISALDSFL